MYFVVYLNIVTGHARAVANMETVCFSPGECCRHNIKLLCHNAKSVIKIAVSHLADEKILGYLQDAIDRGVKVMFITDPEMFKLNSSVAYALSYHGAHLRMPSANFEGNKFAIFDDSVVITGSYEWVDSDSTAYSSNCLVTSDSLITKKFVDRFDLLWSVYDT